MLSLPMPFCWEVYRKIPSRDITVIIVNMCFIKFDYKLNIARYLRSTIYEYITGLSLMFYSRSILIYHCINNTCSIKFIELKIKTGKLSNGLYK